MAGLAGPYRHDPAITCHPLPRFHCFTQNGPNGAAYNASFPLYVSKDPKLCVKNPRLCVNLQFLNVEVLDVQRIFFNELAAALDVLAH